VSYPKFDSTTGLPSLRLAELSIGDSWSWLAFNIEYTTFKPIDLGGGYSSPFGRPSVSDIQLVLLGPQFATGFIFLQGDGVYDPPSAVHTAATPSLSLGDLRNSASVSMPTSSPQPAVLSIEYNPGPAYAFDSATAPPHFVRQGGYGTPEAPSISAIPSTESTPATMAPATSAAIIVSIQQSTSAGGFLAATVQFVSASPSSLGSSTTLGSIGPMETANLPDRISAPPLQQAAILQVAGRQGPMLTHTATPVHAAAAALPQTAQAGVAFLPFNAAASLADIPLDVGRIEKTLTSTIAEIKRLSPDLAGWLTVGHLSPLTVAFAAAAISGGSAYYYLRRRKGREPNRLEDEESSNWLFSRLHSAASQ
jgi:hypothetical protein